MRKYSALLIDEKISRISRATSRENEEIQETLYRDITPDIPGEIGLAFTFFSISEIPLRDIKALNPPGGFLPVSESSNRRVQRRMLSRDRGPQ